MMPLALGLVETFGLVPAIEAADSAVKTADVCLTGLECIGAGLVTVKLSGDISAVKAGVEAAAEAARRLGQVRSQTVIGRTGEGLSRLVCPRDMAESMNGPSDEPINEPLDDSIDDPAGKPVDEPPEAPGDKKQDTPQKQVPLAKMRVVALRKLARTLAQENHDFPLSSEKIKYARKKELIRIITTYAKAAGKQGQ